MGFIDTHSHYFSYKYDNNRDILFEEMFNNGVDKIIECGLSESANLKVIEMTEKYSNVYGLLGFDPVNLSGIKDVIIRSEFVSQLSKDKIVGIGEIGLDYYRADKNETALNQEKWFRFQIELGKRLNLPICIHSRDAEEDTVRILKEYGKNNGVIHCYSYGIETMESLLELGYCFGIGGTSTYKSNELLREVIKKMPLDRIVLETDAPYLSPNGFRGKLNRSDYIKVVIDGISKLKEISCEEVIKYTNDNVKRVYQKIN